MAGFGGMWNLLLQRRVTKFSPITLTGMGERVHLASPDIGMETAIQDVLNVIKFNDLDNIVLQASPIFPE